MRSFLVDYFFKYEKSTPLESFKKFTKGKITDLEVTLKKQPSKRKSESAPGIGTKKSKIDLDTINENQEKLKTSKKAFLEAIAKKEGLSQHRAVKILVPEFTNWVYGVCYLLKSFKLIPAVSRIRRVKGPNPYF